MIVTKDDLLKNPSQVKHKMLVNGSFGVGKTYFAMTYPAWAYAMIEPHGIMTAMSNPPLLKNMVHKEEFVPSPEEDIKDLFVRFDKYIEQVRVDAKAGKVQTFILDNLSHLTQNRWLYIEKYEKQYARSGEVDTRAMYGTLSRWCYELTVKKLLSLPCHVIVTCHEMEVMEEDAKGKVSKTGEIISKTLGGFREDAAGLFNASIYLEVKREGTGPYKYRARCLPGAGKSSKNNIGLPEFVENISYESIMATLASKSA